MISISDRLQVTSKPLNTISM